MKKFIINLICATPLLWIIASIVEVATQNIATNPTYSAWNIFCLWF